MPSASVLTSMDLISPAVIGSRTASVSAAANADYSSVLPTSCTEVPIQRIEAFRAYLRTMPFNFHECQAPVFGRGLESEGDVRLFLEASAVLTCWPVAVSMVTTTRTEDYVLRSEKSLINRNRPDLSVFANPNPGAPAAMRGILAIEFKGPGVLDFCGTGVPTGDCHDAWDTITRQVRKCALDNHFDHIVVMDGKHGIYFEFSDPQDLEANVNVIMVNVSGGPVGFPYKVTARELILFAFYQSFSKYSACRDFSGVAIPADAGTDYVEIFPPVVTTPQHPQARQGTVRRSPRHLVQMPGGQFPVCQIQPSDLTPFKGHDSGFLSTRRMPNDFFLVPAAARRVTMEVGESRGRLLVPAPNTERATTPPLGVVAKEFTIFEILQAHQEATAYSLLKKLQGYTIPFCYGVFLGERGGVALLLEKIKGKPLVDRLCEAFDAEPVDMDAVKAVFVQCRINMQSIHDAGVAHRDISGDNILLPENGDAIFVDFENALPINDLSRKHDYCSLRMVFARFGVEEARLRGWC